MKMKNLFAAFLTVFLLAGLLAGCSAQSPTAYDNGGSYDSLASTEAGFDGLYDRTESAVESSTTSAAAQNRKLIKTVNMRAETKELDALLSWLDSRVAALGGYVEQREVYNGSAYSASRSRSADLTIRIPADQADAFVEEVGDYSNIISTSESVDDVTLTYVATESRMKALQAEEERLLELMAQAEDMSDLLQIEERLTDVRYELESVTSQLRTYDNLVSYATVSLYVSEVKELTEPEPVTLWERISTGFAQSLKNLGNILLELGVFLIVNIPYILVLGVIALVVLLICRKASPKDRKITNHQPQKDEKTE